MPSSVPDLLITRGDAFRASFSFRHQSVPAAIVGADPLNGRLVLLGDVRDEFATGAPFSVGGNRAAGANRNFISAGVSLDANGNTVVTVSPLLSSAATFNGEALAISGSLLSAFPSGGAFYITGATPTTANRAYVVESAWIEGSNTLIRAAFPAIPLGIATPTVTVPALPPGTTASGSAVRLAPRARDLSGYAVTAIAKREASDEEALLTFTVDDSGAEDGEIVLSLTAEQTAAIPAGVERAVADILLDEGSGPPLRFPGGGQPLPVAIVSGITAP